MEAVSNVSWGFQSENQRRVVTGGKEKNHFAKNILIMKSGGN